MRSKKRIVVVVVIALVMSLLGMNGSVTSYAAGKKLNKKKLNLTVGESFKLKVKGVKAKKVKWKSSKKAVATVNKKGKVKAKSEGSAKITARIAKKKLICKVTVKTAETENPIDTTAPDMTADPSASGSPVATQSPAVTQTPDTTGTPATTQSPVATQTPAATASPASTATSTASASPTKTAKPGTSATPTKAPFEVLKDAIVEKGTSQTVDGKSAYVVDEGVQKGSYGTLLLDMYYYSRIIYYPSGTSGGAEIAMQYVYDTSSDAFNSSADTMTFTEVLITESNTSKCTVTVIRYDTSDTELPVKHGKIENIDRSKITKDNSLTWTIEELPKTSPLYSSQNTWVQAEMNGYLDNWYTNLGAYMSTAVSYYLEKLGFGK